MPANQPRQYTWTQTEQPEKHRSERCSALELAFPPHDKSRLRWHGLAPTQLLVVRFALAEKVLAQHILWTAGLRRPQCPQRRKARRRRIFAVSTGAPIYLPARKAYLCAGAVPRGAGQSIDRYAPAFDAAFLRRLQAALACASLAKRPSLARYMVVPFGSVIRMMNSGCAFRVFGSQRFPDVFQALLGLRLVGEGASLDMERSRLGRALRLGARAPVRSAAAR